MTRRNRIWDLLSALLLGAGLLMLGVTLGNNAAPTGTAATARRAERRVSARFSQLERYAERAFEQDLTQWMDLPGLPEDMVLYRYVDDSLQSWCGVFPVANDDLSGRVVFQRLTAPRAAVRSPLADIGPRPSFCNLGPKWYLARCETRGRVRVVMGLEIVDTRDDPFRAGPNPRLHLSAHCAVRPLSYSGGTAVCYGGEPQFKLIDESLAGISQVKGGWLWGGLFCLLFAVLFFLTGKPTLRRFACSVPLLLLVTGLLYFWGKSFRSDLPLFSPALYADGSFFYSLAAVFLVNLSLTALAVCLYMVRRDIFLRIRARWQMVLWSALVLLLCGGLIFYSFVALRSIVQNSALSLELYRFSALSLQSANVYASFVLLLAGVPLLFQLLQPLTVRLWGFRFDAFSLPGRIVEASLVALYLVGVTSLLGFRKEQARLEVWANRLAVSRDIALEVQLRGVEAQIGADPIIASLSVLDNAPAAIQGRIAESFLPRVSQDYDLRVAVSHGFQPAEEGEPIAPNSRFRFLDNGDGTVSYAGQFFYHIRGYDLVRVDLRIDQRGGWQDRGYSGILGLAPPGRVSIPAGYAFARFRDRRLISYRGNYSYPLQLPEGVLRAARAGTLRHLKQYGHTHFLFVVSPQETVVVSRYTVSFLDYVIAVIFLGLVAFLLVSFFTLGRPRRKRVFVRNYFQSRLGGVILASLTLTLVAMATVSVLFVYNRGEANLRTMLSERIGTIQESISSRIRGASSTRDLQQTAVLQLLKDVGENTRSDITLYGCDGRVLMSTEPVVFDRQLLDSRLDGEVYDNIVYRTRRYVVKREHLGHKRFYSMYAPLLGSDGSIIAIIASPYTDDSYDFETNAVNHSIMIVSLFIFLLLVARFMALRVMERMFQPLSTMASRMNRADLSAPELISYDKEDEISGLVVAYNRMVTELSESSKQLAQAERDKAWSGMARQVAHEIKNPLTPMKLQLQRLIRLKQRGDASWQEKFDEGARVLLDHIDILTETANEFSTFARLYTEEPSDIDLGRVLQEEISMFDNRENISFSYMGLDGVVVRGPKPQLTRVFVNLINNAVQALEDREDGKILVSLRNSTRDGFYDIVVEDNGPGVAPENVDKLFTPNFTTKNGGSGLGLAISRSILERCGASISYDRSFALGGACFTILYPK